ncbi:bactericidal permeability-increasing protein-like [Branchiostoma floridae x Branchiostoma japonicum]
MTSGFFLMSDVGRFKVSVSSAYIDVVISMDEDAAEKPTVSVQSCDAGVGGMELVFHGGASWLYNVISPIIVEVLKTQLGEMMCESVDTTLGGWMGKAPAAC